MDDFFPEIITRLPVAEIPISGVTGFLAQAGKSAVSVHLLYSRQREAQLC
jgi:hypothetical protein